MGYIGDNLEWKTWTIHQNGQIICEMPSGFIEAGVMQTSTCCIDTTTNYILTCKDDLSPWGFDYVSYGGAMNIDGFVTIGGAKYCDDFGRIEQITILGNKFTCLYTSKIMVLKTGGHFYIKMLPQFYTVISFVILGSQLNYISHNCK